MDLVEEEPADRMTEYAVVSRSAVAVNMQVADQLVPCKEFVTAEVVPYWQAGLVDPHTDESSVVDKACCLLKAEEEEEALGSFLEVGRSLLGMEQHCIRIHIAEEVVVRFEVVDVKLVGSPKEMVKDMPVSEERDHNEQSGNL